MRFLNTFRQGRSNRISEATSPLDACVAVAVTVISDATMARRHFARENLVGQRFRYGGRPLEIIGVVGDVKYQGLERENEPVFYQLSSHAQCWDMWLLVRPLGDSQALTATVRNEIRSLDPVSQSIVSARGPRRYPSPFPCSASGRWNTSRRRTSTSIVPSAKSLPSIQTRQGPPEPLPNTSDRGPRGVEGANGSVLNRVIPARTASRKDSESSP
jgi:hypothetical protein